MTEKNSDQTKKTAAIGVDDKKKDKEEKEKIPSKDDSFREFRRLCSNIANVDAYTDKTAIIKTMFTRGKYLSLFFIILSRQNLYIRNVWTKIE